MFKIIFDANNCFICFTAGEKALFDGVFFGVAGGIAGAFIGLKEKKFVIRQQKSRFAEMKQYMKNMITRQQLKLQNK